MFEFNFLEELSYQNMEEDRTDYYHSRHPSVELRKAWDIFNHKRFSGMWSVCDECYDMIDELSLGCSCEIFNHFVGQRWLCIPCLLVEETGVYNDIRCKTISDKALVSQSLRDVSGAHSSLATATLHVVRRMFYGWRHNALQHLQAA
jgi:hypothetical protein